MKPIKSFLLSLFVGTIITMGAVVIPRLVDMKNAGMYASFIVLISTTLLIFTYTSTVSSDHKNLSQDAADYAYYLGFSLTIVALVSVFMTDGIDLILNPDKKKTASSGIQTILLQFGSGLFATMTGVVARIYLIDKLTSVDTPVDESVRQLRFAIGDLVSAMNDEAANFTNALGSAVIGVSESLDSVKKSTEKLAKSVEKSCKTLEESIDFDQLDVDIKEMEERIKLTHGQLVKIGDGLTEAMGSIGGSIDALDKGLSSSAKNVTEFGASISTAESASTLAAAKFNLFSESVAESSARLPQFNKNIEMISNASGDLKNRFEDVSKHSVRVQSSLAEADQSFNKIGSSTVSSFNSISATIVELNNQTKQLQSTLASLSVAASNTKKELESINVAIASRVTQ